MCLPRTIIVHSDVNDAVLINGRVKFVRVRNVQYLTTRRAVCFQRTHNTQSAVDGTDRKCAALTRRTRQAFHELAEEIAPREDG